MPAARHHKSNDEATSDARIDRMASAIRATLLRRIQHSVNNKSMDRVVVILHVPAHPHNLFFFVLQFINNTTDKIKHLKC
jgi:ribosome-binding factor A